MSGYFRTRYLRMLPALMLSSSLQAATLAESVENSWETFSYNVQQTWQHPDAVDLYIPAITWHNRWTYDDRIDRYNERPWGAGIGVSRYDNQDNWHGLYLMAFKDSYNKWEPVGGYGWQAIWRPLHNQDFHWGAGFTAGITARNSWDYYPVPVLLPVASIGYGPFDVQMTYVPGVYNRGNVFFAWLRWSF